MKIKITEQQVITSYGIFDAGAELETKSFCKRFSIGENQANVFLNHLVNEAKCAMMIDADPIQNKIDNEYTTKKPLDNSSVRTKPDKQTSKLHTGKKPRNSNKR